MKDILKTTMHSAANHFEKDCGAASSMVGTFPPEIFYALPDLQFIVLGSNAGESAFCTHERNQSSSLPTGSLDIQTDWL